MSEPILERRKVRVRNRLGLHARPAAELVKLAGSFESDVRMAMGSLRVNGKSIMGVLMLAAEQGTELLIEVEGPDAREAADAIVGLIERGFGER